MPTTKDVVALAISFRRYGTTKITNSSAIDTTATTKDRKGIKASPKLRVIKQIVNAPELDAIKMFDLEITRYLCRRGSRPRLVSSGLYVVKTSVVPEILPALDRFVAGRKELVDKIPAAWERIKEDAKALLGPHFAESDYPDAATVTDAYSIGYTLLNYFDVPLSLEQVSADLFRQEQAKAEAKFEQVLAEMQSLLRAEFSDLVKHIHAGLGTKANGRPKRLYASVLKNFTNLLADFETKEITADEKLRDLVVEAKAMMSGADINELRHNEAVRAGMRDKFEALKAAVEKRNLGKAAPIARGFAE